ncbi:MAG: homocysteine S-methyltransferase [Thiotrichales bacterium]|nr:homocysteine S-methyltransferase [Thiotrichales bacterium]
MHDRQLLTERFRDRHVIDGGLATELEQRGHDITGTLWSGHIVLNDPRAIEQLHFDYLRAGADIIISSSYQLTFQGMIEAGYSAHEARRALELSVELALSARQHWSENRPADSRAESPLIAASVGPYGAYRADGSEYTGDYDLDTTELTAFHRERVALLVASQADLLAFETVPAVSEAIAFTRLMREFGNPPAWISFSCRDGDHLSDGTGISEAADAVLSAYPELVAVGVNCTAPGHVESVLDKLAASVSIPLIAYPNSGEGWDAKTRCWVGENDPVSYSEYAQRWLARGATLIGGCCRTGPAHVRDLRALLG